MDPFELQAFARELLLPPTALLILAVAGFLLALRVRFRTVGILLSAAATAALWLLATPVVSSQLTKWIVPHVPLRADAPVDADAVVILAGGARRYAPEYNADVPNDPSLQRLAYGARVARRTALPILISGGRGEALAMREFLVADFGLTPRWLRTHPGVTEVQLKLLSRDSTKVLRLADGLRVTPSPALFADLKQLLGPGCLQG